MGNGKNCPRGGGSVDKPPVSSFLLLAFLQLAASSALSRQDQGGGVRVLGSVCNLKMDYGGSDK